MKKISGAEAIIRCLISEDVDVLFGTKGKYQRTQFPLRIRKR